MDYYGIDYLAMICLLFSFWGFGNKTQWAFPLNLVGSLLMIPFGIMANSPPTIFANSLFAALAVVGWFKWHDDKINKEEAEEEKAQNPEVRPIRRIGIPPKKEHKHFPGDTEIRRIQV